MSEKFDVAKWHQKALEDSRLEGQLFRSVPASSYEELFDRIASLEAEVEALKAERRWIPVSERLPECEKDVLVFWGKALDGSKVDWFGTAWRNDIDDGKWCTDPIVPTHWMPLPQPPEVK